MKRETVELVDGSVYFSDDHWRTIDEDMFADQGGGSRRLKGKEADRIRYIALVQHGGGRDEVTR